MKNAVYHLQSILRQLKTYKVLADNEPYSVGHEALADNIDWLDNFIYELMEEDQCKN